MDCQKDTRSWVKVVAAEHMVVVVVPTVVVEVDHMMVALAPIAAPALEPGPEFTPWHKAHACGSFGSSKVHATKALQLVLQLHALLLKLSLHYAMGYMQIAVLLAA